MRGSRLEAAAYLAALAVLAALVVSEGARRVDLERRLPVEAREMYRTMARSPAGLQVVDVRPDLSEGYEDSHVPGSIPMPNCDPGQAPPAARERIYDSVPTVVVSAAGGEPEAKACLQRFRLARELAGGMAAWSAARLPEDTGSYSPPSAKAGGGCL
jgi:rhodanese-related sulfurtransferase